MTAQLADHEAGGALDASVGLETSFTADLRAKALAGLFAAGATLALLTVALPHSRRASEVGLLTIVGCAYATATVLFARADRVPARLLPFALALGSTSV